MVSTIHARLERYVSDFSQKDIPPASAQALNAALKSFGLSPVAVPQSANEAAWNTMVARELSVTKSYSSHMGHDVDLSAQQLGRRRRIISDIANRVGSLGPSLTDAELKDAAAILTLALRNTP